jgi:aryl-alcohol dehydrogenase-like predicted oxidoreductase
MGSLYLVTNKLTFDSSQDETSEQFIGEWAEKRGIRDQLVIATKASTRLSSILDVHERTDGITSIQLTSSGAMIMPLTR